MELIGRSENALSSPTTPTDSLSAEQANDLLNPVDHIRDPIHGDIQLTAIERFLIDLPDFKGFAISTN